ncbi:MAG TPA: glycine C-acetyltransferase [Gaiellaceae bacterium]|nr:glycine C-acetyltransferase [Gaiellaceae bacterium]HYA09340.1 glycine C-acetyltransferase [Gaiellaceae bacterium]
MTVAERNLSVELRAELDGLREAGTLKRFNTLGSPQGPVVEMAGRGEVLVLSSNNYLGLAARPEVVEAGIEGLRRYGAGTASVRFICGTFAPHLELERELAELVGTEAALTYVSCWNANEAVIPSLTDERTVILSDALNHASIVDAIRLSKPAAKVVYAHSSMDELRVGLEAAPAGARKLVVTDGVFSMEGDLARLPEIVELANRYGAIVIVDDSHGTGVMGATGRGVAEHFGLTGQIDVITSTLGKALGGAAGGFVASSAEVCEMLAQRSRPQLFSNALPPTVACSALEAVRVLRREPELPERLRELTRDFRRRLRELGFDPLDGEAAIVPVIVGETEFAIRFSERLLDEGVFVTGFGFPVVPEGTARIRVQLSAALEPAHLDRALEAFERVGSELGVGLR